MAAGYHFVVVALTRSLILPFEEKILRYGAKTKILLFPCDQIARSAAKIMASAISFMLRQVSILFLRIIV